MNEPDVPDRSRHFPCIWVSAGVLTYGLCDRDFDCDDCPLHQALSRSVERHAGAKLAWPQDREYTPNQLWVRIAADGTAEVGITAFAAEVLQPVQAWHFPEPSASVPCSSPLATVETEAGSLPLTLPFTARLIEVNHRVGVDRIWPLADPWETGFLARVEADDPADIHRNCASLHELEAGLTRHRQRLIEAATQAGYFQTEGIQAADGGIPLRGWASVLGSERYRNFLADVFLVMPG